jgi:hypothetical protein
MFFCNECKVKNKWGESIGQSRGRCEVCGKTALCNDIPSKYLPVPEPEPSPAVPVYAEPMAPRYKFNRKLAIYTRVEPYAPITVAGENMTIHYEKVGGKSTIVVTYDLPSGDTRVTRFFMKSILRVDDTFSMERKDD